MQEKIVQLLQQQYPTVESKDDIISVTHYRLYFQG